MWNSSILLGSFRFLITKAIRTKEAVIFHVRSRRKTAVCPLCKKRSHTAHGLQVRRLHHGTVLDMPCILHVTKRRFFCLFCNHTFQESFDFATAYQRATLKHKREVINNLADRSFSSGTKRYGVSYSTQRKWLIELVSDSVYNFEEEKKCNAPFVLGIDEVSFAGRDLVTTIGNITTHKLKGVLRSRRKDELKKVLKSIPSEVKPLIVEAVIDMCPLYLNAVQEVLPHVQIVVDHFHIIQDANRRIDSMRLILQDIFKKSIPRYIFTKNKEDLTSFHGQYLAEIIKRYPELTMFWETKERLRTMYRAQTKEDATEQLRLIIATLS